MIFCIQKLGSGLAKKRSTGKLAEQKKGELACLYVNPIHENRGIGRKLIAFVETKARESGLNELITLSTQAFTYFQSKGGFAEGTPDDLPHARREK